MPHLRIVGLVLAAAALWTADDAFATAQKPLRETLKAAKLEAAATAPFEELLKLAATDDQRVEALGMLAEALRKAELHERAAAQWGAIAGLERKRQLADRTQRVWDGEMNRLRSLERIKPLPAALLAATAKQALQPADPAFSVTQRMALVGYAVKGLQAEKNQPAAAAWVAELVKQTTADGPYRNELLLQLLGLQEGQPLPAVLAICDRVAADPQALPEQAFLAISRKAYILGVNRRSSAALDEVQRLEALFTKAVQGGWKPNLTAFVGLRWAAGLARRQEDLAVAERLLGVLGASSTEREWIEGARLDLAAVRRVQKRWAEADAIYAELMTSKDTRLAGEAQLNRAFLAYRDQGDVAKGLPLVEAALRNEQALFGQRVEAAMTEARRLLGLGDRAAAIAWFARVEGIPGGKAEALRALSQALVEMGQVAESASDKVAAKGYYQRALEIADGDLEARLRARDAIKDMRYFE